MSQYNTEKDEAVTVDKLAEVNVAEVKVVRGSEAYHEALIKEKPIWNWTTIKLILCLTLGFFCQTMNGFDGSILGGLTANPAFLDFFNGSHGRHCQSLIGSIYQIGNLCALPFVGLCVDNFGRRIGMLIGAGIIVMGVIINGTTVFNTGSDNNGQLIAGRLILGFGVTIVSAAGPIYVVETAHPAWRSLLTAYCNTFWFVGHVLAAGAIRGLVTYPGNESWTIPIWLQMVFPAFILLFSWFIPESPRWLYVNNKREQATAVLTKWHGQGNPDSAWVTLQLSEYEEYLNLNGADKRFWDLSALFRGRSNRYRTACNGVFSAFGQLAGNGIVSYFITALLETIGIKDPIKITNINLGLGIFQWGFSLIGAAFVERVGRRKLMLFSMAGCTCTWVAISIASAQFAADDNNQNAARAVIAFVFIFGAVYSIGITPLQALYPVEVLSYEQRAKGMAFSSFSVNSALVLNQWAVGMALEKIGWKTFIIWTVWCAVQTAVFYFLMPETRRRTLEELDKIFEARNPVRESLKPHKIAVNAEGTVLASEEL